MVISKFVEHLYWTVLVCVLHKNKKAGIIKRRYSHEPQDFSYTLKCLKDEILKLLQSWKVESLFQSNQQRMSQKIQNNLCENVKEFTFSYAALATLHLLTI